MFFAKEVSKSVNGLVAIRWVAMAWSQVKEETIRKCFCKAGILGTDMSVVERDEQDPFSEADEYMALPEPHDTDNEYSGSLSFTGVFEW